jgi:hypothetical protein
MAEDDPHAVEGLLIYIYTLEYPDWRIAQKDDKKNAGAGGSVVYGKSSIPAARWETHLGLFKLADKLCLRRLKAMAKRRLQSTIYEEWTLGNFHQLLEELWHMQQTGVEEVKAVALKVVSSNAADLMVKPQFQDLLSGDSSFNIDLMNQLINNFTRRSREIEKDLELERRRSERNRKGLQEVVNSWVIVSSFCNVTNKGSVSRILDNWENP